MNSPEFNSFAVLIALVLGGVALFVLLVRRWRTADSALWTFVKILVLFWLAIPIGFFGLLAFDVGTGVVRDWPTRQHEYDGIKLGDSTDDVVLRLGKPNHSESNTKKGGYTYGYPFVDVQFSGDGKVDLLSIKCGGGSPWIMGLSCNDSIDELVRLKSHNAIIRSADDGTWRTYAYKSLNFGLIAEKGKIVHFFIFLPSAIDSQGINVQRN